MRLSDSFSFHYRAPDFIVYHYSHMDRLILIKPAKTHEEAALDYLKEHITSGEEHLHGSSMFETMDTYDRWLEHLKAVSRKETVPNDWVISSTFFAVREHDGRIVGMLNIRHELNDFLRDYGGNIGYGVRPSERRKGYATRILQMALDYCRELGLRRVMVSCNKENIASRKTILKCGGVFEREFTHTDGQEVQVFWITL